MNIEEHLDKIEKRQDEIIQLLNKIDLDLTLAETHEHLHWIQQEESDPDDLIHWLSERSGT